jgi:hypothetical protein
MTLTANLSCSSVTLDPNWRRRRLFLGDFGGGDAASGGGGAGGGAAAQVREEGPAAGVFPLPLRRVQHRRYL